MIANGKNLFRFIGQHCILNRLAKAHLNKTTSLLPLQSNSLTIGPPAREFSDDRSGLKILPDYLYNIDDVINEYNMGHTSDWYSKALEYNLKKGKHYRQMLTVLSYEYLMKHQGLEIENTKLAHILGWCVELFQAAIVICDDIMDGSTSRRGQLCWYKLPEVGITALNDAIIFENSIYVLLRQYFRNAECYLDLMELFNEITLITACGQNMDMLGSRMPVKSFTMEMYRNVAITKTAYYSFYLPFALAMHLAGIKNPETFKMAKCILLEMGYLYQVQNDVLDCFGNPKITGKIGTDIEENKCSWLAVECLRQANEEQQRTLVDCYGKKDPKMVKCVKDLYQTLQLPKLYADYEDKTCNQILTMTKEASEHLPKELILQILKKIFKRKE
ncbi:farnesyl pyrophosphate synthase-like [Stomoxys calcitrans]|uniref:farnesyl pyrophosphate synthase-like n=1 Tax=Stomoxys calcitrans TaxID=35570 RepID=UPI0027E29125|nr:farnesyl pyrophosphate synthase-like [Stomoxys calcitrans]